MRWLSDNAEWAVFVVGTILLFGVLRWMYRAGGR